MADDKFEGSEDAVARGKRANDDKKIKKIKKKAENLDTGQLGEQVAAEYLQDNGWTVIARNYTTHIGEIDLIVQRDVVRGLGHTQILAFVEVKARRDTRRASPAAAVTSKKRKKLSALALLFIQQHEIRHVVCRFDVVAVNLGVNPAEVTHYENAFDVLGRIR